MGALVALSLSTPALAYSPGCRTRSCDQRAYQLWLKHHPDRCSNQNPRACVEEIIRLQHLREPEIRWLRSIPSCESSWEPEQVSGPNEGLYQFNVETWASMPFAIHSPLSAYWNTRAAAWGYKHLEHGPGEWACTAILGLG
jgi:hypothetical protein